MDSATKICYRIGVSRETALFFLEGSGWDSNLAMENCRDKLLSEQQSSGTPPQQLQLLPTTPERKPPLGIMPEPEQKPHQSREELILAFCEVALGTSSEDAEAFLQHCEWNVAEAIGCFMDKFRPIHPRSKPHRVSEDDGSYSQDYPPMSLPSMSQFHGGGTGSSSSSMGTDPTEIRKSPKEDLITVPLSLISSPEFNLQESRSSKVDTWIREETFTPPMDTWVDLISNETNVSRFEALYYLEGFKWNFDMAMEACRNKTFPPVMETSSTGGSVSEISSEMITPLRSSNQQSNSMDQQQLYLSDNNASIDSFLEAACGATREEAITFLNFSDWDVNQAVCHFFDRNSKEETAATMAMWQLKASNGSQNQGYSDECVIGSSSSLVSAEDLTDTGLSLEEAGKEKATVAVPGMASSQVDINLNDKEDSSTETFPNPCALQDSITLELVLATGTSVKIPFRSDQTVRDIRDAIDKRTTVKDKEYFLQSTLGENYRDMNTTVSRIISAGSGTLIQTFPDQ